MTYEPSTAFLVLFDPDAELRACIGALDMNQALFASSIPRPGALAHLATKPKARQAQSPGKQDSLLVYSKFDGVHQKHIAVARAMSGATPFADANRNLVAGADLNIARIGTVGISRV